MGWFDFFRRKDPIQKYLDEFFKSVAIVDVVDVSDIPILKINGNKKRATADIFFMDHARMRPHRIASFIQDSDVVLWIFDTFFVFELNASKDDNKQFVVLQFVNFKHGRNEPDGLTSRLDAMESSIKILGLKEQLRIPTMETIVFKEAWNFFTKSQNQAAAILQRKYPQVQP